MALTRLRPGCRPSANDRRATFQQLLRHHLEVRVFVVATLPDDGAEHCYLHSDSPDTLTPSFQRRIMAGNGARKGELRSRFSHQAFPSSQSLAPPPASNSKLVDFNLVKKTLDEMEGTKRITLKVKKPAPKSSIPGNWKESETISTSPPLLCP